MRYLIFFLLMFSINASAQWKTFKLTPKGDTLNRIDLQGKKQGPWLVQVPELRGERGYEEEGYYIDDQKEGMWRRFSMEGDMLAVENFRFGMKDGKCLYFTNAGEPEHEEMWRAIDPQNPYDTVEVRDVNDPTKVLRMQIIKIEPISYKHGTWVYYNTMNGTIDRTEQWVMNQPKVKESVASDDDMAPIDVTDDKTAADKKEVKKTTKPAAVLEYEKKNAGKKKIKVRDGQTGG